MKLRLSKKQKRQGNRLKSILQKSKNFYRHQKAKNPITTT